MPIFCAILLLRRFVTPSSEELCQNLIALKFARKRFNARAGNPHKQVLGLGASGKNDLEILLRVILI